MTTSPLCTCATYTARGCWEHSTRDPNLVMAYRLGYADGTDGFTAKYRRSPVPPYTADELAWYEAGYALATWRAKRTEGVR